MESLVNYSSEEDQDTENLGKSGDAQKLLTLTNNKLFRKQSKKMKHNAPAAAIAGTVDDDKRKRMDLSEDSNSSADEASTAENKEKFSKNYNKSKKIENLKKVSSGTNNYNNNNNKEELYGSKREDRCVKDKNRNRYKSDKEKDRERDRDRFKDYDRRDQRSDRDSNKYRRHRDDRGRDRSDRDDNKRSKEREREKEKQREKEREKEKLREREREKEKEREREKEKDRQTSLERRRRSHSKERREKKRSRSRSRSKETEKAERTASVTSIKPITAIPITRNDRRANIKVMQLEKMGIDVMNTIKKPEGVELPAYYNPGAINPTKYADQVQKRKLLWGNKKQEAVEPPNKWENAKFSQDTDGKVASKFMRLMGIKDGVKPTTAAENPPDSIKNQEELFSTMEQQYELARQVTHTMRGVGLGFGSQPRQY